MWISAEGRGTGIFLQPAEGQLSMHASWIVFTDKMIYIVLIFCMHSVFFYSFEFFLCDVIVYRSTIFFPCIKK